MRLESLVCCPAYHFHLGIFGAGKVLAAELSTADGVDGGGYTSGASAQVLCLLCFYSLLANTVSEQQSSLRRGIMLQVLLH